MLMDDTTLKMLNEADWDDIAARVLVYVRGQMTGKGLKVLPGGHTAEDVVQTAIARLFDGKRGWDPKRYPDICLHVQWIAKSLLSKKGLLGLKEKDTVEFVDTEETLDVATTGDEDCAVGDETVARIEELYREVAGDQRLRDVVTAIVEMGCEKSGEIADITGYSAAQVYELRRKLSWHVANMAEHAKAKRLEGAAK